MFALSINANVESKEAKREIEEVFYLDCQSLAEGYYNFMVEEEGVSPRRAARRARRFLRACVEV